MLKTIIVTGANKGIGFALVRALCKPEYPSLYKVVLTARDIKRGTNAMGKILDEFPEASSRL